MKIQRFKIALSITVFAALTACSSSDSGSAPDGNSGGGGDGGMQVANSCGNSASASANASLISDIAAQARDATPVVISVADLQTALDSLPGSCIDSAATSISDTETASAVVARISGS
ncbi:hypothetical protein AB833_03600 [Chromatiales bacterium (ex Bugula neritina AB1)]|nr:hypothetical protein AB833_03600 [Chromatiales bacterium (ex Bugula neritina AB1)]